MTNSDLSTAIDLKHELDRIAMIASCIRFVTLAGRRAAARVDASPRAWCEREAIDRLLEEL